MHAVALWIGLAHAQPSPARLCADAASGTEIEVCLRLAVAYPDAIAELTAALVAHVDRSEEADRELLDGLLRLAGPDGAEGARRLGELGDPRALVALAVAVAHREEATATAAVEALAAWPEAWPTLGEWLDDEELPFAVRLAAAKALAETGDDRAAVLLKSVSQRPGIPQRIYREVVEAFIQQFPDREPPQRGLTPEAALWLAGGAGVGLGFALGAKSYLDSPQLWPVAVATGAATGVSIGWTYGRAWPMEPGDGALITVSGLGGGASGALLGAALAPDGADGALVGGLVGELVGFTTATSLRKRYPGSPRDVLEASAFTALTTTAAQGALFAYAPEASGRQGATGGVLLGSLVTSLLAAPLLDVTTEDLGLIATASMAGASAGLLFPIPEGRFEDTRLPLLVAGPAGGAAVGLLLADPVDLGANVWIAGLTGSTAGNAVGAGAGLLASDDPRVAALLALSSGGLGLGLGALAGQRIADPIDDRDVLMVSAATTWTAAEATILGTLLSPDGRLGRREIGGVALASGLASATTASLNLSLDVPVPHTLTASSVGMWGAYVGGAVGTIVWEEPRVAGLVGTNLGLASGVVLISDLIGTPPLVISMANAGGVLGACTVGLGAWALIEEPELALGLSLGGATAGAVIGGAIGRAWHRSGERR
ncbi:MAG TPA: hypothetical protein ENK18_27520, partial [Deltaproteobacteria bacterium]|nr:hypothetical protein [Deltaproteobacteria bacterium]